MSIESNPASADRERALARAVWRLDNEYRAMRVRVVAAAGISMAELDVLSAIAEEASATPKTLAAAAHLTTSAMTALLDRLSTAGLTHRLPHPTDRRSVVVVLTDAGQRLINRLWTEHVAMFGALVRRDALVAPQLERLIPALERVTDAIAAQQAPALAATA